MTIEKAALMEIGVLRHNSKAMLSGILPDDSVGGIPQTHVSHMSRVRIFLL
jgi:hypothetical protein